MNPLVDISDKDKAESERLTHLFFVMCSALVFGFFVWAYYGTLDIVSTATGEVIPSSQVKLIQHLEGGIVREILVREGETVSTGQALVSLEATDSGSVVDELQVRITALSADIVRLEGEANGHNTLKFPDDLVNNNSKLVRETIAYYETRKSRINNQLAEQNEQISQRNLSITEITNRIANTREKLSLLNEQVKISEGLMEDQLTNRMQHLNLLKEVNGLRGKINDDKSALNQANAAHKGALNKLETIRDSFQEKVREELENKRRTFEEFSSRVRKFEDSLRRTVLRSPVDGVIKTLHVVTVGGVVAPGSTVAEIVPAGDKLIIEAKLPPQDIGYVNIGQTALVTLASPDASRFGNLQGEVIHISADTIQAEGSPAFYKVRISTTEDYFEKNNQRYNLVPGVQVLASIRTGQRSVMSYIIDPFINSANQALRER